MRRCASLTRKSGQPLEITPFASQGRATPPERICKRHVGLALPSLHPAEVAGMSGPACQGYTGTMLESVIQQAEAGQHLSIQQASEALGAIMDGRCQEAEVARLLVALHRKGETVDEVAGAAAAMRDT